jgi:hypothetical protein
MCFKALESGYRTTWANSAVLLVYRLGGLFDNTRFDSSRPSSEQYLIEEVQVKTDVSVVLITICRKSLYRAVRSVFQQDFKGTIHLLVAADVELFGDFNEMMATLLSECPANITLTAINLGYSTSVRHGGVHSSFYGGSLRTSLTFLSSSELVTYLDDDDWYTPQHIRLLVTAMKNKDWAFTLSNYADQNEDLILGVDLIESVGPNRGLYKQSFGGFVRPSALMINKLKLTHIIHLWSISPFESGDGEDRLIFKELLKSKSYGETGVPTVNCSMDPADGMHEKRI